MLDHISNYKKLLASCFQGESLLFIILLRQGTLMQNHETEVNFAVLWREHRAIW